MTLPTIHLNGTGLKDLIESNEEAYQALDLALRAMARAAPNGRDYYPQGPDAIGKAVSEHEGRMRRVHEVMKELQVIGEHLGEEEIRRLSKRA